MTFGELPVGHCFTLFGIEGYMMKIQGPFSIAVFLDSGMVTEIKNHAKVYPVKLTAIAKKVQDESEG